MGSVVRVCAVTATSLVALSFILFATDQLSEGSENQIRAVKGEGGRALSDSDVNLPAPPKAVERERERRHSSVREAIDDANDLLVAPFTGIVGSDEIWVKRIVPAAAGLLLYGFGGLLLANWLPRRRRAVQDWRGATG